MSHTTVHVLLSMIGTMEQLCKTASLICLAPPNYRFTDMLAPQIYRFTDMLAPSKLQVH